MAESVELEAGGRLVKVSNPGKVYYPEPGYTKLDVAVYYQAVAEAVLRGLRDRPTTLQRFVDGVEGESFYQKRAPKNTPEWLPTARISFPSGRYADEICPTEPAAVLWAANLGCLTFHPWPVRRDDTDHPDELRIDLDPQPGTDFTDAVRAAHQLREVLAEHGLRGWPKTSGGRGLHVYVPIRPQWTFAEVRRCAIALGRALEHRMPDQVTTNWWKEERGVKVFVDYNQMARDRTIASAYSLRARPQATVSTPLHWVELDEVTPLDFTLRTVPVRLAEVGDPNAEQGDEVFGLESVLELAERQERDHGLGELPYPPDHPKAPGEPPRVQPSRARKTP
ncbi:non-homologous end-joining DNA ligase [Kitasatospora viridis]|uniref:DNA ligase D n=1 Tax=Kitasatospora viridis TaxID=281105 RepID=A0A561UPF2_9ACTN|nr:non-homologous end-joining DNA ligase [Kitasatospora viridis]TWG01247.1 DNA ligase D [Kitasatospora viridis]